MPPADDKLSLAQAKAASVSLAKGQDHNQVMVDYVNNFIAKLTATRDRYATTEENNTDTIRNADTNR